MKPRELVIKWVEEFNKGDATSISALYSDRAVNHQVAECPVEGKDAIEAMFAREFAQAKMTCIIEIILPGQSEHRREGERVSTHGV